MKTDTEKLLKRLKIEYTEILQGNLVGIYLHGSYAFGCYNELISDLDYLVVVKEPITYKTKRHLLEVTTGRLWALAPAKKLESHVVLLKETKNVSNRPAFELHFSKDHYQTYQKSPVYFIKNMQGTDIDLVAHFMITTNFGQVLTGRSIAETFGIIPEVYFWYSIYHDIENAQKEIIKEPMHYILNLCRVLAYKKEKLILSKYAGGKWGMCFLPSKYFTLVKKATKQYINSSIEKEVGQYFPNELHSFASEILSRIIEK